MAKAIRRDWVDVGAQRDKPLAGLMRTLVLLAPPEMNQMTGVV